MLWPLSCEDDNWRSMIHTQAIYHNALTVVMRWLQLTVHDSYLRDIYPCPDRGHETMTTEGACYIHEWYITMLYTLSWDGDNWWIMLLGWMTMLCPLSWDDGSWQSMLHTLRVNYPALSVIMWWWQLTEHDSYLRDILPCSDRCHGTMTTDGQGA